MATYFNRSLCKRNLVRFWPLAILTLITSFFVFVAPLIGNRLSGYNNLEYSDVFGLLSGYCASAVPLFSCFSALAVFGFLHNQKASSYISALPISRLGLYITNYISGLLTIFIPNLIISFFFGLLLIGSSITFPMYLSFIAILTAAHLLFYSIAVFAAFLTGNPFMQVFLYALINFIYSLLYLITYLAAEMFVFGYNSNLTFHSIFSPPIAMIHLLYNYYRDGLTGSATLIWIVYLAFAAILIVCGYHLYKRRRIETAGDTIIHKVMKPIFKYILSFIVGVLLGSLFVGMLGGYNDSSSILILKLTLSSAFFGSLCCLFTEMLINKKLRVWQTVWKGILVYICAVTAIAIFIKLDGTGFERRVPDISNISAVSVDNWNTMDSVLLDGDNVFYRSNRLYYFGGDSWHLSRVYTEQQFALGLPIITDTILAEIKLRTPTYFESPEGISAALELHRNIIAEKPLFESFSDGYSQLYNITYKLKDGTTFSRRYKFPLSIEHWPESANLLLDLYNLPESLSKRTRFLYLPDDKLVKITASNLDNQRFIPDSSPHIDYASDENYKGQNALLGTKLIDDRHIPSLIAALRRDAQEGTLGLYDRTAIGARSSSENPDKRVTLSLCYDESLVPYPFQSDEMHLSAENYARGLVITITIGTNNTNSIKALQNAGFDLLP